MFHLQYYTTGVFFLGSCMWREKDLSCDFWFAYLGHTAARGFKDFSLKHKKADALKKKKKGLSSDSVFVWFGLI